MPKSNIQIGQKYSRLTVVRQNGYHKGNRLWDCRCDCGLFCDVMSYDLTSGHKKSCGCLKNESIGIRAKTHGLAWKAPEYSIWQGMLRRCLNPNRKSFKDYGARGITVCERWNTFENFLADMGERPPGMSIERINNNGNYEPLNCRWATKQEQARNTTRTLRITIDGETKVLREWAELSGLNYQTITNRIQRGYTAKDAVWGPREKARRKIEGKK